MVLHARQDLQPQFMLPEGFRPATRVTHTQVREGGRPVPHAPSATFDLTIDPNGEVRYADNPKVDGLDHVGYRVTCLTWQSREAPETLSTSGTEEAPDSRYRSRPVGEVGPRPEVAIPRHRGVSVPTRILYRGSNSGAVPSPTKQCSTIRLESGAGCDGGNVRNRWSPSCPFLSPAGAPVVQHGSEHHRLFRAGAVPKGCRQLRVPSCGGLNPDCAM